ncbi:MAG: hypothetical protein AB1568_14270 [Thermodesulfobacteriota bacterium]
MQYRRIEADGLATLIGSIPLADHRQALDLIFRHTPQLPLWPQLPGRKEEKMLVQFLEGFPGAVETEGKAYFQTDAASFQEELVGFFEEYLAIVEQPQLLRQSRFRISRERGAGLHLLPVHPAAAAAVALKGQTTGPFTLLTGLTDEKQRLAYYDPTLRELVVKGTAMKAAWQVDFLRTAGKPVILFIDEPALAGLGSSSFISISREDIAADLTEVITAIHEAGGMAGVHVCANTDWNLLLGLDLDIINFDAYSYFDRFVTSREAITAYLRRGGIIAWGGVPTSDPDFIARETCRSLVELWQRQMRELAGDATDYPALLRQTLITPSCGTGSLSLADAEKVIQLSGQVSAELRRLYLA